MLTPRVFQQTTMTAPPRAQRSGRVGRDCACRVPLSEDRWATRAQIHCHSTVVLHLGSPSLTRIGGTRGSGQRADTPPGAGRISCLRLRRSRLALTNDWPSTSGAAALRHLPVVPMILTIVDHTVRRTSHTPGERTHRSRAGTGKAAVDLSGLTRSWT